MQRCKGFFENMGPGSYGMKTFYMAMVLSSMSYYCSACTYVCMYTLYIVVPVYFEWKDSSL